MRFVKYLLSAFVYILAFENGFNLGSNTHTAFPRNIFSSVPFCGWRPIFLDDLFKTVTNVSTNHEDYE